MKDAVVRMRVSDEEQRAIAEAASVADMTVSAFVRSLSLQGAGVRPFLNSDDRQIMRVLHEDLRAIGVHLNQLARAVNAKNVVDANEIKVALLDVERVSKFTLLELKRLASRGRSKDVREADA